VVVQFIEAVDTHVIAFSVRPASQAGTVHTQFQSVLVATQVSISTRLEIANRVLLGNTTPQQIRHHVMCVVLARAPMQVRPLATIATRANIPTQVMALARIVRPATTPTTYRPPRAVHARLALMLLVTATRDAVPVALASTAPLQITHVAHAAQVGR